ncbi:hypothetical protein GWK47_047153 [Chionoecetes opilio]|uniref:Uncharacterized protein n=1 Tax=Chionoecetes opilio TaxID=41210 RepID=A0A8J4YBG0_CHIOP|nr:hypothetical protein GWK47_047153 [Chionoecetes opilio]
MQAREACSPLHTHTALAAADTGAGSAQTPGNGQHGQVPGCTCARNVPEAAKVQDGGDKPPQRQLNLPGREVPFKARAVRAPHRRHDERVLQYRVQGEASGVSNKDTSPAGFPPCQHDAPWLAISHFLRVAAASSVAPRRRNSPEAETSTLRRAEARTPTTEQADRGWEVDMPGRPSTPGLVAPQPWHHSAVKKASSP